MRHVSVWVITAATCCLVTGPAWARPIRYHRLGVYPSSTTPSPRSGVIRDALIANPYGDTIITGKTGFHRSDVGVMVPDDAPQNLIATGRASGSGLGAAGLPGSNQE